MTENNQTFDSFIISDNLKSNKSHYLTVVMPAYNEEANIASNLTKTSQILSKFINNYQILVVNDGSTDNTEDQILRVCESSPEIAYISYKPNQGKGSAIRQGVKYANGQYIAFLDSDLELNPIMLRYFLRGLQSTEADIAIGSKLHPRSKLKYPISRRILSLGYFILLKLLFNLNLRDTQTGIKLFKGPVIKSICENLTTTGFAFDIEILATASKKGYKIIELPIELNYSRGRHTKSRISLATIINMFRDTINIKKKIK